MRLDIGRQLGNWGELSVDFGYFDQRASATIGDPDFPIGRFGSGAYFVRFNVDTVDNVTNALLQMESPDSPCGPFLYHREYGSVSNAVQIAPGAYQVTVMVRIDGKNLKKVVGFDVGSCDFNPTVVVDF